MRLETLATSLADLNSPLFGPICGCEGGVTGSPTIAATVGIGPATVPTVVAAESTVLTV